MDEAKTQHTPTHETISIETINIERVSDTSVMVEIREIGQGGVKERRYFSDPPGEPKGAWRLADGWVYRRHQLAATKGDA